MGTLVRDLQAAALGALTKSTGGAPDDIVAQIGRLAELGVAGSTLVFLNYLDELPYFVAEVLPRLERAGLRGPQRAAA